MKTKELSAVKKQIAASIRRISKERGSLRELISDAAALEESCDRAIEALRSAADALSEFV